MKNNVSGRTRHSPATSTMSPGTMSLALILWTVLRSCRYTFPISGSYSFSASMAFSALRSWRTNTHRLVNYSALKGLLGPHVAGGSLTPHHYAAGELSNEAHYKRHHQSITQPYFLVSVFSRGSFRRAHAHTPYLPYSYDGVGNKDEEDDKWLHESCDCPLSFLKPSQSLRNNHGGVTLR